MVSYYRQYSARIKMTKLRISCLRFALKRPLLYFLCLLLAIGLIVDENTIESKNKLAREKLATKISLLFGRSSSLPTTS